MSRFMFLLYIATGLAVAQPAVQPTAATTYPTYFVSTGGGYTRNTTPNTAEGWISTAFQIGANSPYYSITTIDLTASSSTIRTGVAKVFGRTGNLTLLGRVDAGISTVVPVIGNFSGGMILLYDLKGISARMAGVHLLGEIRVSGVTATSNTAPNQVSPGFYFGIGRSF